MASVGSRFLALAFCVVIGITMLCNFHGVSAQKECKGTPVTELIALCKKFVEPSSPKIDPSAECCSAIKGADIPCLCKHVTNDVEKMVSMEKVDYVCKLCGNGLPAGRQCGSYTVPPSMA